MHVKMAHNIVITTFSKHTSLFESPFKPCREGPSRETYQLCFGWNTGHLRRFVDNVSAILQSIVLKPAHFHSEIGYPSFIPWLDLWHALHLGKRSVIMGLTFRGIFSKVRIKPWLVEFCRFHEPHFYFMGLTDVEMVYAITWIDFFFPF